MLKNFIITAHAENVLRVLQKLTSLMSRKHLKIEDMQVQETNTPGRSYISLALQTSADHIQWLVKQMKKCIDLFDLDLKLLNPPPLREENQQIELQLPILALHFKSK